MTSINVLHFAVAVMIGLAVIFVIGMILFYTDGQRDKTTGAGQAIFDACKTILPPIAMLVLGYYFGQVTTGANVPQDRQEQSQQEKSP